MCRASRRRLLLGAPPVPPLLPLWRDVLRVDRRGCARGARDARRVVGRVLPLRAALAEQRGDARVDPCPSLPERLQRRRLGERGGARVLHVYLPVGFPDAPGFLDRLARGERGFESLAARAQKTKRRFRLRLFSRQALVRIRRPRPRRRHLPRARAPRLERGHGSLHAVQVLVRGVHVVGNVVLGEVQDLRAAPHGRERDLPQVQGRQRDRAGRRAVGAARARHDGEGRHVRGGGGREGARPRRRATSPRVVRPRVAFACAKIGRRETVPTRVKMPTTGDVRALRGGRGGVDRARAATRAVLLDPSPRRPRRVRRSL